MTLSPWLAGFSDFPFGRGTMRDPLDFGVMLPSLSSVAPTMTAHPLGERAAGQGLRALARSPCSVGAVRFSGQEGGVEIFYACTIARVGGRRAQARDARGG